MTPPQIKEQIQVETDIERIGEIVYGRHERGWIMWPLVQGDSIKADLRETLSALRGLEATANEPGEAVTEVPEIKFAIADYLELRDEAHGFVSTDEERSASAIELHDAIQRIHAKITHPAPQDGVPAPVVSERAPPTPKGRMDE